MRLDVVDIIKGISIIMIVNVHLISGQFFPIGGTYHVIAFFFTAGIIHGFKESWNELSVRTFFFRKLTRLMYPYIALSSCYICFHALLNVIRGDVLINDGIIESLIKTATLRGIGTLWFLPILFLGEILFFVAKKKEIDDTIILFCGGVFVVLSSYLNAEGISGIQWYNNNSLYGILLNTPLSLFCAGCITVLFIELGYKIFKTFPHLFLRNTISKKRTILMGLVCLGCYMIDYSLLDYYVGDIHKLNIGNSCVYLICSVSGILFVCTLSILINCFGKYLRSWLLFFGINSLIIMTTHTEYYINSVAHLVITNIISLFDVSLDSTAISGLSLFLIMVIEIGIVFFVNYTPLRFLYAIPKLKKVNGNSK